MRYVKFLLVLAGFIGIMLIWSGINSSTAEAAGPRGKTIGALRFSIDPHANMQMLVENISTSITQTFAWVDDCREELNPRHACDEWNRNSKDHSGQQTLAPGDSAYVGAGSICLAHQEDGYTNGQSYGRLIDANGQPCEEATATPESTATQPPATETSVPATPTEVVITLTVVPAATATQVSNPATATATQVSNPATATATQVSNPATATATPTEGPGRTPGPRPTQPVPATATNVPATNVPTNIPATNVPATNIPATNVPATNVPATNVPATNIPATNVPATPVRHISTVHPTPVVPHRPYDTGYEVTYDSGCWIWDR